MGTVMITVSMYMKVVNVEPEKKSFIEHQEIGYSDVPEDNGL